MHSLTVIEDCGDVELGKESQAGSRTERRRSGGRRRPHSVLDRSIGQFKRGGLHLSKTYVCCLVVKYDKLVKCLDLLFLLTGLEEFLFAI